VLALKSVAQLAGEVSAATSASSWVRIKRPDVDDCLVGVRLLLTTDLREARSLAEQLDKANAERQELQARIATDAIEMARGSDRPNSGAAVVSSPDGTSACRHRRSRLVEKFHRPALVIAEELQAFQRDRAAAWKASTSTTRSRTARGI